MTPPAFARRLAWMLACTALGAAAALIGVLCSGSQLWYLALPGAMAAGWVFVADPTRCLPPAPPRPGQR